MERGKATSDPKSTASAKVEEAKKANKSSSSSSSDTNINAERKLKVLIVEDNRVTQRIEETMAMGLGLETQIAANGKIAVDLHRCGASFDLILMDLEMPIMNGIQATTQLRAMGVGTMIVGVTAVSQSHSERQLFQECGLNHCFAKPLTVKDLSFVVNQVKQLSKGHK